MKHYRVAVLRGGPSSEYDVSMRTGAAVLNGLAALPYHVTDVTISKTGEWLVDGFARTPESILQATDVVFIALHGTYGEAGTIQRLLDRHGVPYTGSQAFASGVSRNKILAKERLADSGIVIPRYMRVSKDVPNQSKLFDSIEDLFGPEYVIKPVDGGSSIDTHIVTSRGGLEATVAALLDKHEAVLVEERIVGREATVGVIENYRGKRLYQLPSIEIVPRDNKLFTHQDKSDRTAEEICPGRFTKAEKAKLEAAAVLVHKLLELNQYSRSDFIVSDGEVYFLEANSLPDLSEKSSLPVSLAAVGCAYSDFLDHLLTDALGTRP